MRSDWRELPFEEAIDFQEGPGILAKDFRPSGVALVRLAGLGTGASVLDGCDFLDPAMVERRWSHFRLKKGDILLSTSASLGRIAIADDSAEGAIPYTGIIRMRPRAKGLDALFIKYLLESPHFQRQVEAAGVGSVIRHFGPMHLRQMTVLLPPPPEQRAIAAVLGSLDDKIDLNRRMNATLEATARAIFKAWFVDFEALPVEAGRREPVAMVAERTARYGPQTGLAGWQRVPLGEICRITMGQSPPGDTYNEEGVGIPLYQGSTDFGFRFPTRRVFCTGPTRIAEEGDTLLSVRAPVGDLNVANERCCVGRGVAALRHKSGSSAYTLYLVETLAEHFRQFDGEGTVFGSVNRDALAGLVVMEPPPGLIGEFDRAIGPLDRLIRVNDDATRTLAALRDTLLPKLLSGEIRVKDVA